MLVTLIIEFSLAIYTIVRYKMTTISRLAVAILIVLGFFQLSEYTICGGLGLTHIEWAKLGYITTALLPAFGIHLIIAIADKKKPLLISIAYATSAIFVIYYLLNNGAISGHQCYANYAVFYAHGLMSQLFGIYYFCWLVVGFCLAWHWSNQLPSKRKALRAVILGGLIFIVPTYFFNVIDPSTTKGIPSIMCGFAVLFALVLVIRILPISCRTRVSLRDKIQEQKTKE
jgi:hypothetical protein